MTGPITNSLADFAHTVLPVVQKTVFRMGVAGSYGIDSADIRWAADQGAKIYRNYRIIYRLGANRISVLSVRYVKQILPADEIMT